TRPVRSTPSARASASWSPASCAGGATAPSKRMQRALVAAAVAALLALAGCGSGGHVTQGNPDLRDGAGAVDTYAQIEFLRALLISSSDAYYAGGSAEDAKAELQRARAAYGALAGRVAASDPVLARQVGARL